MNEPLSVLRRGPFAESVHSGAVAIAGWSDRPLCFGDADTPVLPRSAIKPFQAIPLLEDGLDQRFELTAKETAILAASHSGDEDHVATVRSLQEKAGVQPGALRCGIHAPMDVKAATRVFASGARLDTLHHNCSGKHTGMLIQAAHAGAPLDSYLDPTHPVQTRIRSTLAEFAGLAPESIGVAIDGCSAPAWRLPLSSLAQAFRRFAAPDDLPPPRRDACHRLWDAILAEPHSLSGRRRIDKAVAIAGRGRALSKIGAEGVLAVAVRSPDGGAIALAMKVADGALRGCYPVLSSVLLKLGIDLADAGAELPADAGTTLTNHAGLTVGEFRPSDEFQSWLDRLPPR